MLSLRDFNDLFLRHAYEKHIRHADYQGSPSIMEFFKAGNHARTRMIQGANRCGKTTAAARELTMHLTGLYADWWEGARFDRPINAWIILRDSKYFRFMYDTLFGMSQGAEFSLVPGHLITYENRGDMSFKIKHVKGGFSNLQFKSAESGREKMQSSRIDFAWFDEEPPGAILSEVRARLAQIKGNSGRSLCVYTLYPGLGMTNLIHDFWYDGETRIPEKTVSRDKWYCIVPLSEVRHMTDDEKVALEQAYPEDERDARIRGIPYIGKGLVYAFSRSSYIGEEPNGLGEYIYGLDVGYTNQTALLAFKYDRINDVLYCVDEYYENKKSIAELCEDWAALDKESFGGLFKGAPILCDPAIKQKNIQTGRQTLELFNDILMEKGLASNFIEANNRREVGIEKVRSLIRGGKLKISEMNCPNLLKEFSQYAYVDDGKIPKNNDHALDALRYAVSKYQEATSIAHNTRGGFRHRVVRL